MSDNTAKNKAALLTIAEAVLEDYFAQFPQPLGVDESKELKHLQAYIARRKQALLQPKPTRKPKAQASGKVAGSTVRFEPDAYENSNPKTGRMKS